MGRVPDLVRFLPESLQKLLRRTRPTSDLLRSCQTSPQKRGRGEFGGERREGLRPEDTTPFDGVDVPFVVGVDVPGNRKIFRRTERRVTEGDRVCRWVNGSRSETP